MKTFLKLMQKDPQALHRALILAKIHPAEKKVVTGKTCHIHSQPKPRVSRTDFGKGGHIGWKARVWGRGGVGA